tara:strand:- start:1827 stop:2231 length:405 start_codon:yes stop_codon:yes gene_type:complete
MNLLSTKDLAEKRINICLKCEHFNHSARTCGTPIVGNKVGNKRTCGCFMDAKTKLAFSSCPLGFWEEYQVSELDYKEMKQLLDDVNGSINAEQKSLMYSMLEKYAGGTKKATNCVPCLKGSLDEIKRIVEEYEK